MNERVVLALLHKAFSEIESRNVDSALDLPLEAVLKRLDKYRTEHDDALLTAAEYAATSLDKEVADDAEFARLVLDALNHSAAMRLGGAK